MSTYLWRFFLEDDLQSFRQLLASATYSSSTHASKIGHGGPGGNTTLKIGSPSAFGSSPTASKSRKGSFWTSKAAELVQSQTQGPVLTRADVNAKDSFGRTILHHAASSTRHNAIDYVVALLGVTFLDIYAQDLESGWTALHRAFYFGNVAIAHSLMERDIRDATDYTTTAAHAQAGGLVKIKDHEGNSPFEVFSLTIKSRDIQHSNLLALSPGQQDDDASVEGFGPEDEMESAAHRKLLQAKSNLFGDEAFTFGSNKNLSLGLGDEDDRQFPERVALGRPEHLLHRFLEDHKEQALRRTQVGGAADLIASQHSFEQAIIPTVVRSKPLSIQDMAMSKLHTAVITNDPESNLFICGFGPGGRLGTGDETTRFAFVCIETGGLAGRKIIGVGLGQDHSIAISEHGEVFTWGSNRYGQLGYTLPNATPMRENAVQTTPRQIYGTLKKEIVLGAAASAIHSVIFTTTGLYTFGKNEGQLGLMDADARSLECQTVPRRVGVSLFNSNIEMVAAIDRATTCLLANHDVVVLTHYGWTKLTFPLEGFTNYFLKGSFASRYNSSANHISKITCGGNTICAMSSYGEVFTVKVDPKAEAGPNSTSTTNPTKARNALPSPFRVWSIKKAHMAVTDVDVGQDGSIIICTESGSVWRKEKRAKIKDTRSKSSVNSKYKDYKFVRVPNLTRAVAVRTNAYGAFAAIRKDTDITREQIAIDRPLLWTDMYKLLVFKDFRGPEEDSDTEHPRPRFWTAPPTQNDPASIKRAAFASDDLEADMTQLFDQQSLDGSTYDIWISSTVCEVRIPAHAFLLAGRSGVLRRALNEFHNSYYFSIPESFAIEYGKDGQIQLQFVGADFLTLVNFVFYIYTDHVIDVWHHTRYSPERAFRYKQVRIELMKIADTLDMRNLERAARLQLDPASSLHLDMEVAFADSCFFEDGDLLVELADEVEVRVHSALVCARCPFFDGLFHGRAGGRWLASRRSRAQESTEMIKVDLKHVGAETFNVVLKHIYADSGEEIFDDVASNDLDELIDLIIEVMSVANELMLDRLSQISQKLLGRYGTCSTPASDGVC